MKPQDSAAESANGQTGKGAGERADSGRDRSPKPEPDNVAAVKDGSANARSPLSKTIRLFAPLLPCLFGLAIARTGIIVGSYGSYTSTDEGIFTDGSMILFLATLLPFLAFISKKGDHLDRPFIVWCRRVAIVGEALSLLAMFAIDFVSSDWGLARLVLSTLVTGFGSLAIFYWLRRARNANNATAVVFAFIPLAISEVALVPLSFMPATADFALMGMACFAQLPLVKMSFKRPKPFTIDTPANTAGYFGFSKSQLTNKWFLVITAIGIGLISIVIGLLRGYPDGTAIPFTPETRIAYALLTIAICLVITAQTVSGRRQTMTISIWIVMEALCALALLTYALLPQSLEYGAVFTTTLNALMVAFTWYVIIAFESNGWRDAYYYAVSGWLVWLGCRSLARIGLLAVLPADVNTLAIQAVTFAILLVSTQAVFSQFVHMSNLECRHLARAIAESGEQPQPEASPAKPDVEIVPESPLTKLMGLDGNESLADIRYASMEHNARELGKQFLLSEREIEVVTLYALGFTQKRVAEELFISQGTAHAHIKRIYAKTGLHSRQELLDYLQKYAS